MHYTSAPGGIEVLIPDIIRMLPDASFSVFVIRPPVKGKFNVYNEMPVKVRYGSKNNLMAALRLLRFARRNRGAVFHGFNTGPFFLLILRMTGIKKAVYSIHGTQHYSGRFQKVFRRTVWHMAISPGYKIIANSEYSRALFLDFVLPYHPEVKVLYNPISSTRIKHVRSSSADELLTVIYVGRLAEGKNMFLWLDMAAAIHRLKGDSRFYIYGDGPLKEKLAEYCTGNEMCKYVSFMGFVTDISEAYSQADLLMFLSEYESFGNAVVESILSGTPVIASDIPAFREIFNDFQQFLVKPGALMEAEIIEKIVRLDELKKLVPEAAMQFSRRFSVEQHINGLRMVYDSFPQGKNK